MRAQTGGPHCCQANSGGGGDGAGRAVVVSDGLAGGQVAAAAVHASAGGYRGAGQGQEAGAEVVAEPGRVHSSVRAEPPTSWLASTGQTDQPASASRRAAANPLGPPPATTASNSAMAVPLPTRGKHRQPPASTSRRPVEPDQHRLPAGPGPAVIPLGCRDAVQRRALVALFQRLDSLVDRAGIRSSQKLRRSSRPTPPQAGGQGRAGHGRDPEPCHQATGAPEDAFGHHLGPFLLTENRVHDDVGAGQGRDRPLQDP